ncbi:MAG: InlB B-repeat-containing protein, partial [Anaerolineales bacterium]|nr:InlB B-repeat-containing protein [Anaerolineales bacterium]
MNARYSRLKARLRSRKAAQPDTGQGLTEYAIILGLVALAVIAIINLMGPAISNVFANFVERAPVAPPDLVGYTRIPPTATATTNPNPTLTISTTGGGLGSIDLSPAGTPIGPGVYTFPAGTAVTLTANPDPSNYFNGWGDDLAGSTNPVEVLTMNADYVVSANFEQIKYTLTINITGNGDVTASPAKAAYDPNDVVILDAVPLSGASFITWGGDLSGNADPETLIMDGDKTVDAIFTVSCYDLAVSETPPGGGSVIVNTPPNCGSPATQYNHGTTVSLTANPAAGYAFNDWSGDASGTNATTSVQMDGPRTAVANFSLIQYTLTINIVDGGTVVGSNTVSISPNQPGYLLNDVVTLTANPDTGKQFVSWSGDLTGTANPGTVTMDADKVINANFGDTCYALTLGNVPGGGGTVNVSPSASAGCASGTYVLGEIVTLAAAPANGYEFTQWTGDISGTNSTALVTMDANKAITANYQQCYTLSVTPNPGTAGSVVVSPAPNCAGGATYSPGTGVSLTAAPNSGYQFGDWSGDVSGTANPVTITMDNNKSVTANFTGGTDVLFVVGSTNLSTADTAVRNRLQTLGYVVTVVDDGASQTSDATGKVLIVISSSVNSGSVNTKFRDVSVPVLVWENALYDDMRMTGTSGGSDYGTESNEKRIDIVNASHPLAGGLPSGTNQVTSNNRTYTWGVPQGSYIGIAFINGSSTRYAIFGFDAGATMASGFTAPAKRVGFFLENDTINSINSNGVTLFDAA